MKKVQLLMIAGICAPAFLMAQKASATNKEGGTLLDVANEKVTKAEFERVYRKNNFKENKTDSKSLQEYLELFINYKLKVRQAMDEHLDTSMAFKTELNGYRKQLAQPYLTDRSVSEALIKEVYNRMSRDIRASHILIKLNPEALPKDTLLAYNKAMAARERILKGEKFETVAKEFSQDPSVKENHGDLGFFTAMQMVYPFETAAYNAKVGEVTMPVRTKFGYHILKVTDSRPAQGELHVAHIMVKTPPNQSKEDSIKTKNKIDELYKKIKEEGSSFEDLARQYSDDVNSGRNGGVLPWFSTGRMVAEFEQAAYSLNKNGDISAPIRTSFGWHIIKRLDKKPIPSFEAMQAELKAKVAKDSRSEMGKTAMLQKIKKEYKFTENAAAKNESVTKVDSTLAFGTWSADKQKELNKTLFTLLDKKYTQQDFASYMATHQTRRSNVPAEAVAMSLYTQFVEEKLIAFEDSRLDQKYPEFRALMNEYRDGILLFDITDKKVWSKAVHDSAGLADFFNANKAKYMWSDRLEATIYSCNSEAIAKKVREELAKPNMSNDTLLAHINKNSQLNLSIKEGKFSKGENEIIDSIPHEKGLTANFTKNKAVVFVAVKEKHGPEPKTLDEARGLITADYQNQLEKDWIAMLRNKYHVTINNTVLNTIKP